MVPYSFYEINEVETNKEGLDDEREEIEEPRGDEGEVKTCHSGREGNELYGTCGTSHKSWCRNITRSIFLAKRGIHLRGT